MTDRYRKLPKSILNSKTAATTVICIFIEHWVPNYDVLSILLTDKGQKLELKLFLVVCKTLKVKNITINEYHRQASV